MAKYKKHKAKKTNKLNRLVGKEIDKLLRDTTKLPMEGKRLTRKKKKKLRKQAELYKRQAERYIKMGEGSVTIATIQKDIEAKHQAMVEEVETLAYNKKVQSDIQDVYKLYTLEEAIDTSDERVAKAVSLIKSLQNTVASKLSEVKYSKRGKEYLVNRSYITNKDGEVVLLEPDDNIPVLFEIMYSVASTDPETVIGLLEHPEFISDFNKNIDYWGDVYELETVDGLKEEYNAFINATLDILTEGSESFLKRRVELEAQYKEASAKGKDLIHITDIKNGLQREFYIDYNTAKEYGNTYKSDLFNFKAKSQGFMDNPEFRRDMEIGSDEFKRDAYIITYGSREEVDKVRAKYGMSMWSIESTITPEELKDVSLEDLLKWRI